MLKKKILMLICLLAILLSPPCESWAGLGKIDNLLEAIIDLNRKIPTGSGSKPIWRQTKSFDTLIRQDPKLMSRLRRVPSQMEDVQTMMRRLNIPQGTKYADEFLSLGPAAKHAVNELGSTAQTILRRSDGADVLQRLDKSGLLMIQRYGDDILPPVVVVLRNDDLWGNAATATKALNRLDPVKIKKLNTSLNTLPAPVALRNIDKYQNFSNADRVKLINNTLRAYGKTGFEKLKKFTGKIWTIAKKHPRKTAMLAAIAVVWIHPELVLTPVGSLKDRSVQLVDGIGEIIGEALVEIPSAAAGGVKDGATERAKEALPDFIVKHGSWLSSLIGWAISFLVIMIILYLIPFTRFLPAYLYYVTIGRVIIGMKRKIKEQQNKNLE